MGRLPSTSRAPNRLKVVKAPLGVGISDPLYRVVEAFELMMQWARDTTWHARRLSQHGAYEGGR